MIFDALHLLGYVRIYNMGVIDALDEFHRFERSGISEYRIANAEESAQYTMNITRRTRAMEKIPSLPRRCT